MYEGMKKAFGPSTIKSAPLKSAEGDSIKDCNKQMEKVGQKLSRALLEGNHRHQHSHWEYSSTACHG